MKRLTALILVMILALTMVGCKMAAYGEKIQLEQLYDFGGVIQIDLDNAHNGKNTIITNRNDIIEITAFVGEIIGQSEGSGKGYYEGSYALTFYYENGESFALVFGDSDCFYMGKGNDGYPIRYILCNINISEDVIPFFSQYDQSGFEWYEAN